MITSGSRAIGVMLTIAAVLAACSTTPGSASVGTTPLSTTGDSASAVAIPSGFPIGSWTTTIDEADLRAGGVTSEGLLAENAGTTTLTISDDGTWSTTQVTDVPVKWPVFKGTWSMNGADGFTQVTTFPPDFAGDSVDFTWKIENGSLVLDVVNPPDPILPILMESHPWQPAG